MDLQNHDFAVARRDSVGAFVQLSVACMTRSPPPASSAFSAAFGSGCRLLRTGSAACLALARPVRPHQRLLEPSADGFSIAADRSRTGAQPSALSRLIPFSRGGRDTRQCAVSLLARR